MILLGLKTSPLQIHYKSFEHGDKVSLKTWMTASPESQLEEKWTGPWDILLTMPHHGEVGRNKTLDPSHQNKRVPEEQKTAKPQDNMKAIF